MQDDAQRSRPARASEPRSMAKFQSPTGRTTSKPSIAPRRMITTNRESPGADANVTGVINGLAAAEHPSPRLLVRKARREVMAGLLSAAVEFRRGKRQRNAVGSALRGADSFGQRGRRSVGQRGSKKCARVVIVGHAVGQRYSGRFKRCLRSASVLTGGVSPSRRPYPNRMAEIVSRRIGVPPSRYDTRGPSFSVAENSTGPCEAALSGVYPP